MYILIYFIYILMFSAIDNIHIFGDVYFQKVVFKIGDSLYLMWSL